jgi:hypothetical protein
VVTVSDLVHAAYISVHYSMPVDCDNNRHAQSIGDLALEAFSKL